MVQFLVHDTADSVGVATVDIKSGERVKGQFMDSLRYVETTARQDIPLGHKIAIADHKKGDAVMKYCHDIGEVTTDIRSGDHVHTHNLKTKRW